MSMTVFVTGASAGFGAAIARKFITEGHRVVAAGRRQERLKALAGELGTDRIYPVLLDVRDRSAVEAAVSALPPEFAEIDVAVHKSRLARCLGRRHPGNRGGLGTNVGTSNTGYNEVT